MTDLNNSEVRRIHEVEQELFAWKDHGDNEIFSGADNTIDDLLNIIRRVARSSKDQLPLHNPCDPQCVRHFIMKGYIHGEPCPICTTGEGVADTQEISE
jgi:hypothetical protein